MVHVPFDVPVRMGIKRVILLITADLHLFVTPLGKDSVRCAKVTSYHLMTEPQAGGKSMNAIDLAFPAQLEIIHDLDHPIIVIIAYGGVAVARNFVVELCDGCRNWVGV
jgi:hypothetical protein